MKKIINTLFIIIITVLSGACGNKKTGETKSNIISTGNIADTEVVELSPAQISTAEIISGSLQNDTISPVIDANGYIALLPNSQAAINPPMDGFVGKIFFIEGAAVKKNDVLFELKHPGYIELQKNYIQAYNLFTVAQQEVERQKILSDANVSAQKQYQQSSADFQTAKAQKNALAQQLLFIGISPEDVEKGKIFSSISIPAPFSGVVLKVSAHMGQMVTTGETIIEIANTDKLLLKLNIFEQDINKVKTGQKLSFIIPAFKDNQTFKGLVSFVGKILDIETRTIQITSLLSAYPDLVPGLYAEARIYSNTRIARVLPDEALIRENDRQYIFIRRTDTLSKEKSGKLTFKKTEVKTGISEKGMTEILNADELPKNSNIVIKGAYYLKSEMNKGKGDND